MAVTLTSPALGLDVGDPYTGPEEAWLLASGYAKQDGYTGPGVANTGPSDTTPANDVENAANREPAPSVDSETAVPDPNPVPYDFDSGGINTEAPSDFTVDPAGLPLAGGAVTAEGQNFKGTTGVTVGGTAATGVTVVDDSTLEFVAPAKAAGAHDVVVTNANGSKTEAGALTYAA